MLNRPEKYNALDREMFEALIAAGESLYNRKDVRAVVLYGAGENFCAGLDFSEFEQLSGDISQFKTEALRPYGARPSNFYQTPAYIWKQVPMPVVAALSGTVFGGGLEIALGADIRIANATTRMSVMEVKRGLVPDMTATQTLRDLVPLDVAKELVYTGRIVTVKEARAIGLVTRLSEEALADARKLAARIARRSPDAVRAAKQLFETAWHGDAKSGLRREAQLQVGLLGTANQLEAIKANFEKRIPEFEDPT